MNKSLFLLLLSNFCFLVASSKSIAIIGAGGFIGSELFTHLQQSTPNTIVGFDHDPQVLLNKIEKSACSNIPNHQLHTFDIVIYLGGCTGRKSCNAALSDQHVYASNVQNVVDLASRMKSSQTLIFASSSAVADHRKECSVPVTEAETSSTSLLQDSDTFNTLDRYTKHMILRETSLLKLSEKNKQTQTPTPKLIGLRFGTVGGVSMSQRVDLLTNAVVQSAYIKGVITAVGQDTYRPVLWLPDLLRAFDTMIDQNDDESKIQMKRFRIYHMTSFNTKIGRVVMEAGRITGADIRIKPAASQEVCGFSLDASLFCTEFNFTFLGNLAIVLKNIDDHVPMSITAQGTHKKMKQKNDPAQKKDHHVHEHHNHEHKDDHVHDHVHDHSSKSMKCPVCGSHEHDAHQHVLSLGDQPLANDFRSNQEKALSLQRFPLRLVRCTHCHHMHLDTAYDRKILFENYLYESGTSSTLRKYFQWLASKVANETIQENDSRTRTVLEIASNDGSQLDEFKKLGWTTIGVDPAENLAQGAKDRGHHIVVGFWGENVDEASLPSSVVSSSLDAIVAQNVLAHVVSPIQFLKTCYNVMGEYTKLYIQTSQCDMHTKGQFDTSYHEHISFFTAHSFQYAAKLSGLEIVNYEKTPIHGTSCLVTLMKKKQNSNQPNVPKKKSPLTAYLQQELKDGITDELFYTQFNAKSQLLKTWLNNRMEALSNAGYKIGGYGAAAKGMVLLNFLHGYNSKPNYQLEFVVDDALLKQNTYTPGTGIPVVTGSMFRNYAKEYQINGSGVALIVFAWNFWKEISERLVSQLSGIKGLHEIVCILPFPQPRIVRLALHGNGAVVEKGSVTTLTDLKFPFTSMPNMLSKLHAPKRKNVMLITHFYNEEILLPYWIRHHASMFDHAILIDYSSTDRSVQIIQDMAPSTWKIIKTNNTDRFQGDKRPEEAYLNDQEIAELEFQYPNDWHIALTVTEFLVASDLRTWLAQAQNGHSPTSFLIPSILMTGSDKEKLNRFEPLVSQRSNYRSRSDAIDSYHYDHLLHTGYKALKNKRGFWSGDEHVYTAMSGRHFGLLNATGIANHAASFGAESTKYVKNAVIYKYLWTPWPDILHRPGGKIKRFLESEAATNWNFDIDAVSGHKWEQIELKDLHINCLSGVLHGKACCLHQLYDTVFQHSIKPGSIHRQLKDESDRSNEMIESIEPIEINYDIIPTYVKHVGMMNDTVVIDLNVSTGIDIWYSWFNAVQNQPHQKSMERWYITTNGNMSMPENDKPSYQIMSIAIDPPHDIHAVRTAANVACVRLEQPVAVLELCEMKIINGIYSGMEKLAQSIPKKDISESEI